MEKLRASAGSCVDPVRAGAVRRGEVDPRERPGLGRELREEVAGLPRLAVGVVVHEVAHGVADLHVRGDGGAAEVVAAVAGVRARRLRVAVEGLVLGRR